MSGSKTGSTASAGAYSKALQNTLMVRALAALHAGERCGSVCSDNMTSGVVVRLWCRIGRPDDSRLVRHVTGRHAMSYGRVAAARVARRAPASDSDHDLPACTAVSEVSDRLRSR